jgi:agmatine deiminase
MPSSPTSLGYRMPAEWEPHEATWIAWPHERTDWPGKFAAIPWVFVEIVRHLHQSEHVNILVNDAAGENQAKKVLTKIDLEWSRIQFWRIPTNRGWMRDCGPIFLTKHRISGPGASATGRSSPNTHDSLAITNWQFNGWGKYSNWKLDNKVPEWINKKLKLPHWKPEADLRPIVLEGGSIDVNGQGLMLTTEECLLSSVQERNPGLTRADLERAFADYLGVRKVLWLGRGIAGDDTHGHVDDLTRFVAPSKAVTVVEDDPQDENYLPLQENLDRLRDMTGLEGQRLEVVPLPMPAPMFFGGQRLPASYANFYITNTKVLVPTFNDLKDRLALGILADLFPDRQVVGIHAADLVLGLGTLHCLTQQQPAVRTKLSVISKQ